MFTQKDVEKITNSYNFYMGNISLFEINEYLNTLSINDFEKLIKNNNMKKSIDSYLKYLSMDLVDNNVESAILKNTDISLKYICNFISTGSACDLECGSININQPMRIHIKFYLINMKIKSIRIHDSVEKIGLDGFNRYLEEISKFKEDLAYIQNELSKIGKIDNALEIFQKYKAKSRVDKLSNI